MRLSQRLLSILLLCASSALAGCTESTGPGIKICFSLCSGGYTYPDTIPPPRSLRPSPVAGGLSFKAISLGRSDACAVTTAGDAYCWGAIGYGAPQSHVATSPERVPGDIKFDTISVGMYVACGITMDKRTMCWGANDVGQLGNGFYGTGVLMPTPVLSPVASKTIPFKSIAVGGWDVLRPNDAHSSFACGLALTGAVYCWGSDNLGQLGSGVAQPNILHVAPSPVAGDDIFSALAGNGFATACGMSSDGAALCWGSNALGEFGTESPETGAFAPTRVASNLTFVALSTGGTTCGITTTGETYCWGSSGVALGSELTPRLITSMPFVSIAAGLTHACGLTADGTAYCWGSNSNGQLGDGTTNRSTVPIRVATDLRFVRIEAGDEVTCALTATGAAYCWGLDEFSLLGRG